MQSIRRVYLIPDIKPLNTKCLYFGLQPICYKQQNESDTKMLRIREESGKVSSSVNLALNACYSDRHAMFP